MSGRAGETQRTRSPDVGEGGRDRGGRDPVTGGGTTTTTSPSTRSRIYFHLSGVDRGGKKEMTDIVVGGFRNVHPIVSTFRPQVNWVLLRVQGSSTKVLRFGKVP